VATKEKGPPSSDVPHRSQGPEIAITLTEEQIAAVTRAGSSQSWADAITNARNELEHLQELLAHVQAQESHLSEVLIRALVVLAAFPTDGAERSLTSVANELHMSAGTVHRIANTWRAVGVLHQNPRSRTYRRLSVS
jgi:Lon protease-like protein